MTQYITKSVRIREMTQRGVGVAKIARILKMKPKDVRRQLFMDRMRSARRYVGAYSRRAEIVFADQLCSLLVLVTIDRDVKPAQFCVHLRHSSALAGTVETTAA